MPAYRKRGFAPEPGWLKAIIATALHTGSSVNDNPRCRSCMHERTTSLAQGPERLLGGVVATSWYKSQSCLLSAGDFTLNR